MWRSFIEASYKAISGKALTFHVSQLTIHFFLLFPDTGFHWADPERVSVPFYALYEAGNAMDVHPFKTPSLRYQRVASGLIEEVIKSKPGGRVLPACLSETKNIHGKGIMPFFYGIIAVRKPQ